MDESFDIYDDIAAEKKDDDIYGDLPTQKQTYQVTYSEVFLTIIGEYTFTRARSKGKYP